MERARSLVSLGPAPWSWQPPSPSPSSSSSYTSSWPQARPHRPRPTNKTVQSSNNYLLLLMLSPSSLYFFLSLFCVSPFILYRSYHSSYTLLQQHFWFLDTISKWRQTFSPSICSYFRLLPHSFFSARAGPLDVIGWWTYDAKPVPSTYLSHVWSRRCIVGRIV